MKFFTSLILIAASIGLLFIYVQPTYNAGAVVRQQISQYDDAIARATQVAAKRDDITTRRSALDPNDLARLQKFLPDSVDAIREVIDVNGIAAQYSKGIHDVRVSNSGSVSSGGAPSGDTKAYTPVSLSFAVSMTYDQFLKFLGDLERSLHLTDVTALTFAPSALDQTSAMYDYTVTLSTYVLK